MIMGIVLVISFAVAIANLIVDIAYSFIDPRVRARRGRRVGHGGRRAARAAAPPAAARQGIDDLGVACDADLEAVAALPLRPFNPAEGPAPARVCQGVDDVGSSQAAQARS